MEESGSVGRALLFVGAGDGRVPFAASSNLSLAAALHLSPAASVSVQAFARTMKGLVAVAKLTGEPFVAHTEPELSNGASGNARGISADAAWQASRVALSVRYGWTSVAYRRGSARYIPEHAVRHQVTGGMSAWVTPTTQLRIGGVAALGRRATPVIGALEWEACNLLDRGCEFSGVPRASPALAGTLSLPGYLRTDVSLRKQWRVQTFSRHTELALFGTVTNVFNRRNVLNFADVDGERTALQLRPLAPLVIGVDWKF